MLAFGTMASDEPCTEVGKQEAGTSLRPFAAPNRKTVDMYGHVFTTQGLVDRIRIDFRPFRLGFLVVLVCHGRLLGFHLTMHNYRIWRRNIPVKRKQTAKTPRPVLP